MLYQPEGELVGRHRCNCRTLICDLQYADDMTGFCGTNTKLSNRPSSICSILSLLSLAVLTSFGECCTQHATSEPFAELRDEVAQDHI